MSLSDGTPMMTMPVAPANTGNDSSFGWGGGSGIWLIVLFLIFAVCGGWGNNGFGGNGAGNGAGVVDGYVLTSDFANIERKLDGVNNGICDGFYAMNTGMLNGFASVTQAVTSGFSQAELARCNQQMAFMQQFSALQAQMASCCCDLREAIQGVNYTIATQGCDTRNLIQNNTRDIIEAMNCGFRSIEQRMTAQEMAAKDAKIAEQTQELAGYRQIDALKAYVGGQFAYYNPRPVPSFNVAAPFQYAGCGNQYACGTCA